MAEPLKNVYTEQFVSDLCSSWKIVLPDLNESTFRQFVFKDDWNELELKQRMSRLSDAMKLILPDDFILAARLTRELISKLAADGFAVGGFEYMFIPEYIEKNGLAHLDISLAALQHITQYTSCEFAIRPFILENQKRSMEFMLSCSMHQHPNVRRFASEGCRARLPWAMALESFKQNASPIIPILENLKSDNSLFVRKSVANNLNDISKDHPELALRMAKKWIGSNAETNWIVKHGMRTLLKSGHSEAMGLFGYAGSGAFTIEQLNVTTPTVQFGEYLKFQFNLKNRTAKEQIVRLEYAIHFLKSNGLQNKKVFKISERKLKGEETIFLEKTHAIKPISTRKYYPGEHGLSLIVNGVEFEKHDFLLHM